MSQPTVALERHVKQLLNYLDSTKDLSLKICPTELQLHAYIDASYAIHPGSRSHYGIALCLRSQGFAFHAKSGAIKVVCRSSTEAELHAANEASSDILHTVDLLQELRIIQDAVPIFENNQAVIHMMTRNETNFQTKSKHVHVRYDFLREQVADGKVVFRYLSTELQLADLMTKPLMGEKFCSHRQRGPQALHGCRHTPPLRRGVC